MEREGSGIGGEGRSGKGGSHGVFECTTDAQVGALHMQCVIVVWLLGIDDSIARDAEGEENNCCPSFLASSPLCLIPFPYGIYLSREATLENHMGMFGMFGRGGCGQTLGYKGN